MRSPDNVLESLRKHSEDEEYKFEKLYKNLYNIDFFLRAYSKIYAKEGNMTPGSEGMTIDGFSIERVNKLIDKLKDERYQPTPAKRVYIPKKNGKLRPLGIPSTDDKLVQEVVRSLLEAIFDKSFSENSHGFRNNKSCHTALLQIKHNFTGVKWWVEGDIKGFFDNIDHNILINLLKKRIKDEKFLRLIWKFLKAGYLEDFKFNKTFSGTPQGGIISPILSNIYLHELDMYMKDFMEKFGRGDRRRDSKAYKLISEANRGKRMIIEKISDEEAEPIKTKISELRIQLKECLDQKDGSIDSQVNREAKNLRHKIYKLNRKIREPDPKERQELIQEIKTLKKVQKKLPSYEQMDTSYRRMKYVRYADDFLIGIIGSKEDAMKVKEDLTNFLSKTLNLELSQEKTLVTHWHNKVRFLGYDIFIADDHITMDRNFHGRILNARTGVGSVKLSMPHEVLKNFMTIKGYMKITDDGRWRAIHRPYLLANDELEIIYAYNAEFRGLYQYYKFAFDVKEKMGNAHFIFNNSFAKTLAGKYRTKVSKLLNTKTQSGLKKYMREGNWGITFNSSKGIEKFVPLFDRDEIIFAKKIFEIETNVDELPKTNMGGRNGLIARLLANKCEWCGDTKGPFEVHHVKKLKDLKGKKRWEVHMIARLRKTLVLCGNGSEKNCHRRLHNGELD